MINFAKKEECYQKEDYKLPTTSGDWSTYQEEKKFYDKVTNVHTGKYDKISDLPVQYR